MVAAWQPFTRRTHHQPVAGTRDRTVTGIRCRISDWHGGYIERFNKWVTSLPANEQPDQASIQPWTTIPMGFQMGMLGWNQELSNQEQRLRDMSNFATLDDLGIFLEWGLHGAAARMFDESVIMTLASPRSTYFWQLHGLIENWRQRWIAQSQR